MTDTATAAARWEPGRVPIAIVMISLNEGHNMAAVLENLKGFAAEVLLVDSYSSDETVDIALAHGVHVVQREFRGFGDQWNFAMRELPITAPWTMKLDPDERLSETLKQSIADIIDESRAEAFTLRRRLWFMGQPLPVRQTLLRGWRTGTCRFSDVLVNEHPLVDGKPMLAHGDLEHHDSPNMHHWVDKQNKYTTQEATSRFCGDSLSASPKILGSKLERRMWIKRFYSYIPLRHQLYFLYNLIVVAVWRSGKVGLIWAQQRVWVRRTIEHKLIEMKLSQKRTPLSSPQKKKATLTSREWD